MNDEHQGVSLRDYMDTKFLHLEQRIDDRARDMERRLEGMNGLRNEVTADRGRLVEKSVYQVEHAKLVEAVQSIAGFQSKTLAYGLGVTGCATALIILADLALRMWIISSPVH